MLINLFGKDIILTLNKKIELNKDAIKYLYCVRGESISAISRHLNISRWSLSKKINEWGFERKMSYKMTPRLRKFISSNRDFIISRMNDGMTNREIASELCISVDKLKYTFKVDDELRNASKNRLKAVHDNHEERIRNMQKFHSFDSIENEEWKEILGYKGYYVSNMGRVKYYLKKTKDYKLLSPSPNVRNGRLYISVINDNNEKKNLNLARVVGFSFVDGYSEEKNTIDHIDGNIKNNKASNLRWYSQSENNKNAYDNGRVKNIYRGQKRTFIVDDKYEFKTVSSLSRFLDVSETQTRRYISGECKCIHHKIREI